MKITQHTLARQLGLSRSTVAAALNPASPVRLHEETRRRVLEAARQFGYRPDPCARMMRGGRSRLIGILHFGGLLQVAAERTSYAARAVRNAGFGVLSTDLSWSADSARTACDSFLDARVEGVIVAGLNDPEAPRELAVLRRAKIPVVTLSGNPLPWAAHLRGDARLAVGELARHLIGLGHRRLALMTYLSTRKTRGLYLWAGKERVLGFRDALNEAGGGIRSRCSRGGSRPEGVVVPLELSPDPFQPFEPGRSAMEQILKWPARPSAVLCANDDLAFGALAACRAARIDVPRELALTGYDDTAMGALVSLTTVSQPNQAMAEQAVRILLEAIESKRQPAGRHLFPCKMIVRDSSGPSGKAKAV